MAKCTPSKNINTLVCQRFRYMGNRAGKAVTDLHISVFRALQSTMFFTEIVFLSSWTTKNVGLSS